MSLSAEPDHFLPYALLGCDRKNLHGRYDSDDVDSTQVSEVPERLPPQPANTEPVLAVAVDVTTVDRMVAEASCPDADHSVALRHPAVRCPLME